MHSILLKARRFFINLKSALSLKLDGRKQTKLWLYYLFELDIFNAGSFLALKFVICTYHNWLTRSTSISELGIQRPRFECNLDYLYFKKIIWPFYWPPEALKITHYDVIGPMTSQIHSYKIGKSEITLMVGFVGISHYKCLV